MDPPKHPCMECPFRKKSLKGYIGGHASPQEIVDIVMADVKFPCHMQVNAVSNQLERDDEMPHPEAFDIALAAAGHCTGSLIFMNNICKLSRDRAVVSLQDKVGRSEDVFDRPEAMVKYHTMKRPSRGKKKKR